MKSLYLVLMTAMLFGAACKPGKKTETSLQTAAAKADTASAIKYAQGFKVADHGQYKLVTLSDPSGESDAVYRYALLRRGADKAGIPAEYQIVETPVRSVVCMTNLQLSNFIKLDALDKVVGISSTRFLFNESMNRRLEEGKTKKIGIEGEFDNEIVIALRPDIILVSPFKRGGYDAIRDLDIPLVSFLGYKETSPLGQAEWIKFTAMLLGMEEKADSLFNDIERKYTALRALTASVDRRPTVMSGELHSGNWYVVGGDSYLAQLFRDAGADYFMTKQNNSKSGGFFVDFETVYAQGADTDYWRIVNSHNGPYSYQALKRSDSRYADFKAYKEKKVIYCNLREKPFYENTPVEPEIVLADLIAIFHPQLLPGHTPVYYELLK